MKPSEEKKLIDRVYNQLIDKMYLSVNQILFKPTKQQAKDFWCDRCDGFHKTSKCSSPLTKIGE